MPSFKSNGTNEKEKQPNRQLQYKNAGKTLGDRRKKRLGLKKASEVSVELRKAQKDDQLKKRRSPSISSIQYSNASLPPNIGSIFAGTRSDDEDEDLYTQEARKALGRKKNRPIDDLISAGIVPKLVKCLSYSDNPSVQFDAAWGLTSAASGTEKQRAMVVEAGAVPRLVGLLKSPHAHVSEQAVLALGNIAGDESQNSDLVLEHGAMTALLDLIKADTNVTVLRKIVWSISKLCRCTNPPNFEIIKPCLNYLRVLLVYEDKDVLSDACLALSYITDGGSNYKLQAVIDAGIVPHLVELLSASEIGILTPALRTVGNIVSGYDAQVEIILAAGGLNQLGPLLMHQKNSIVKEAARTVANITADGHLQVQKVINAGLIPPVLTVLQQGEFRSQKEAVRAITNMLTEGTVEHVFYLINCGAIPVMCEILYSIEWERVAITLTGISHMLKSAKRVSRLDQIASIFQECGGLNKIKQLQEHEEQVIFQKADDLIDNYFSSVEGSNHH